MDKSTLRRELRRIGRDVDLDYRARASASIAQQLATLIDELMPMRMALYVALRDEPDLTALIEPLAHKREVYLPRVLDESAIAFYRYRPGDELISNGSWGIQEPTTSEVIDPMHLDLIVVPAMAYDREGYRLGRGKGYYDRYLSATRAYTVGVTLELMAVERLPRDTWDIPMDQILRPELALSQEMI